MSIPPEPHRVLARAPRPAPRWGPLGALIALLEGLDTGPDGLAHGRSVAGHAADIAQEMGLDTTQVARIRVAGLLHDVGKVAVPARILRKPGPLTPDEWDQVRRHPAVGARMMQAAGCPQLEQWVLLHH